MPLLFEKTKLPGVLLVQMNAFQDPRGYFVEQYHEAKYREGGVTCRFVQDNLSHSKGSILRGLHYQLHRPQAKLVGVLSGAIYDVAVDIRVGSPTFGQWLGVELKAEDFRQIFIPEGYAHGFCVLGGEATVTYKCSNLYDAADDRGILWNDPDLKIEWPSQNPILSEKDSKHPSLEQAKQAKALPNFS